MPSFVAVAVKVTEVPWQISLADAAIATEGTGAGITVMGILLLVTIAGLAHSAFEVISTVTTSPLTNVEVVKPALLVPALTPFTFHW